MQLSSWKQASKNLWKTFFHILCPNSYALTNLNLRTLQMNEALQNQIEVQRQLNEQLEVREENVELNVFRILAHKHTFHILAPIIKK